MERTALGNTGEEVSVLCLGTMLMGSRVAEAESFAQLDRFMAAGGNFLDTANCYAWWEGRGEFVGDESELTLGRWMHERRNRNQIFLATKGGGRLRDPHAIRDAEGVPRWAEVRQHYEYLAADTVRAAVEGSLKRLGTDRIDLWYAHIDDRSTPLEETLGALNDLVAAGKLRHIACSNLLSWRLERARQISARHGWPAYVAIQQHLSYLRPKAAADFGVNPYAGEDLLDYLVANPEVALLAFTPLLKGLYNHPERAADYYNWPLFDTPDSQRRLATLSHMARTLGVTGNQLVLAWLLHGRAPRVIPVIAASRMTQLEENLGALSIHLDAAQMAELDAAGA
ncbi:aldo/keto reductase [Niveibacterium sp. SC-1]|uniref:aldo/keto reductase n=1 Tax=Niveibacterium sp. SC-1 TaxID=3135646 RepID=UPI00311DF057